MEKNKNLKISTRLMALVLAGEALVFSCAGCAKSSKEETLVSTSYVLEHFSNSTSLDEILEIPEIEEEVKIEDVTNLETMLNYSECLHDLDLYKSKIILNSIDVEKTSIIDFSIIDNVIKEYNLLLEKGAKPNVLCDDSISLYICREKLKNYDILVNTWLKNNGYGIIDKWGKLVVKSMVIDAFRFEPSKISSIVIDENPSYNTSDQTDNTITITNEAGVTMGVTLKKGSIIDDAVNIIYSAQININNALENYESAAMYYDERNEVLNNALNLYKICLPLDAALSDKNNKCVIKVAGKVKDARELIASEMYAEENSAHLK